MPTVLALLLALTGEPLVGGTGVGEEVGVPGVVVIVGVVAVAVMPATPNADVKAEAVAELDTAA